MTQKALVENIDMNILAHRMLTRLGNKQPTQQQIHFIKEIIATINVNWWDLLNTNKGSH